MNDSKTDGPFGKKIFIWLAALFLILACVPSTPLPPPTSSPNDINLFIQQTADAASAQTQTAMPTWTALPTLTSTPISTFTPEVTATVASPVILPTTTPTQRILFYRVKHDNQLAMYGYRSRTADGDRRQTPEVVPLFAAPKLSSGTHRTTLEGGWETYMAALNGYNERKIVYLKNDATALFNTAGFPQLESLTMGGNIITLEQVQGDWALVHTLDYKELGSIVGDTYATRPDVVHKFVVVTWDKTTKKTSWTNPPPGDIYWPLVSANPVWIERNRIEPFPILPMQVTANQDQDIVTEPSKDGEPTGDTFSKGETSTLVEYYPSGSKVWGRLLGGQRWIVLFMYTRKGPTYFTNWNMETLPPP